MKNEKKHLSTKNFCDLCKRLETLMRRWIKKQKFENNTEIEIKSSIDSFTEARKVKNRRKDYSLSVKVAYVAEVFFGVRTAYELKFNIYLNGNISCTLGSHYSASTVSSSNYVVLIQTGSIKTIKKILPKAKRFLHRKLRIRETPIM